MNARPHDVHGGTRVRMRVVRLPPGLAVVLALPVVLVAGFVAVASVAAGVVGLLLAPSWLRRRERRQVVPDEGVTITLDPSAYQTVAGDAPPLGERRLTLAGREPRSRR